ncbi:MAG: RNA polymerase sigma factor [Bauldia sp.]
MSTALYRDLRKVAARYSRRADEADDLVQEALLAAIVKGRAVVEDPALRGWLAGTVRNKATLAARTAVRQRRRDAAWLGGREETSRHDPMRRPEVPHLAPSLQAVLALVLTGHSRGEIAYLLRLSDPALRQRIAALRKALAAHRADRPDEFVGLSAALDHGRIRAALGLLMRARPAVLASHDPDGHLFLLATPSQNAAFRQREGGNPSGTRKAR